MFKRQNNGFKRKRQTPAAGASTKPSAATAPAKKRRLKRTAAQLAVHDLYIRARKCAADGDYTGAAAGYTTAAESGHAAAMSNLGCCYEQGLGVERNVATAVHWYTKAAEKGDAYAMVNLGCCYEEGLGVEKNVATAAQWYTKVPALLQSTGINAMGGRGGVLLSNTYRY